MVEVGLDEDELFSAYDEDTDLLQCKVAELRSRSPGVSYRPLLV